MSIEAMKQALEALELARSTHDVMLLSDPPQRAWKYHGVDWKLLSAVQHLRQAIAEAEKQDKFCDDNCVWTDHHKDCVRASVSWKDMAFARLGVVRDKMHPDDVATVQRFLDDDYTHPQPKRELVGLTEDEIALLCGECAASAHNWNDISFARAIEAKLKEKNT